MVSWKYLINHRSYYNKCNIITVTLTQLIVTHFLTNKHKTMLGLSRGKNTIFATTNEFTWNINIKVPFIRLVTYSDLRQTSYLTRKSCGVHVITVNTSYSITEVFWVFLNKLKSVLRRFCSKIIWARLISLTRYATTDVVHHGQCLWWGN